MFKLLNFSLRNHSILNDISVDLVTPNEIDSVETPYTSVLIGPNGVGKSQLLRCIAEVFRELDRVKSKTTKWARGFNFSLYYQINSETVLIRTARYSIINRTGVINPILAFKDPPHNHEEFSDEELSNWQIDISDVNMPKKLLVSSIMLNDKFTYVDSNPVDFYQYLGIRRTSRSTTTQTFTKKTIKYLFDASKTSQFKTRLSDIIEFMGLEKTIKVSYSIKYKPVFERKVADESTFHKFFNEWWKIEGIRRSEDRNLWGRWYYDRIKNDSIKIAKLLNLLSAIAGKLQLKRNSKRAREYVIDIFSETQLFDDFTLIEELVYLDLLRLEGIQIKKKNTESYSVENSSSGEYHLLISLLGIFSRIEDDSIILIDEPEISLHPNWQMRYIHELKKMFCKFSSCHFVIASHSHFIVSDLKDETSSIISLKRNYEDKPVAELMDINTYGWSAEEILLEIFGVATTRNHYVYEKVSEILELIALPHHEPTEISEKVQQLKTMGIQNLSKEDPLKEIIDKMINKYAPFN